jgi:hypothetical protein
VVVIYVPEIKACEKRSGKLRKFASHFPVPFRLIESPSLTAFARITSGDRWKCSTRASSVCVFDNAINSRSVFIDHPGPVGSRFIATPPAHSTASPVRRQELVESRDDQAEQHHASQYQQTHSLDRPSRKPSSRSISSLASLRSRPIARNASSAYLFEAERNRAHPTTAPRTATSHQTVMTLPASTTSVRPSGFQCSVGGLVQI